jgi:acetylornithine deacetylase
MTRHDGRAARDRAIAAAVSDLERDLVGALQALVQTSSQTGDEGAAQDVVARLMAEDGLEVERWEPDPDVLAPYAEAVTLAGGFAGRPNVVGVCAGAGEGRSLILNGHIDTVEIGERTAWQHDPLGGEVVDGRLYGRGACDMKGGLIANLFALRALRRAGFSPAGAVTVESTISEEDGGAGALAAVLRGYTADAALITEPTDLAIVPAHGGALMFRLHVPGLSAHAAVRDEGVSAVEKFALLHRGLLAFEARHNEAITHPLYATKRNKAPINVGVVRAGAWPSSVPEQLIAEGRAGLAPGEELGQLKEQLAAEVAAVAAEDAWLRDHPPTIEWLEGQFAPSDVPVDSPLVATLAAAWESVSGQPVRIDAATYGADMRHFVNTGHTPCVMFGAGDVRHAHAPNESIRLDDLVTATTTIAVFIADWCGVV